jgi:hypothetical protein
MIVFMVVVFSWEVGGTNIVSGGRRGCEFWVSASNSIKL